MNATPLSGLIPAVFTPFRQDGSLHRKMIQEQARLLKQHQVSGVFVCGTTGEGYSLTVEERKQVAEAWREACGNELKLIVHVGHECLADSRHLAEHAQSIEADAVAAVCPSFFSINRMQTLVDVCKEIAAAAPRLPFYYYHIPSMTGSRFKMSEFLQAASAAIPNLGGIKFTDEDLMDYADCLEFAQRKYDMLFGRDEILLSALALGAQGAVGSTYNFAAPIYHRMMDAFRLGNMDLAREQQARARRMIGILLKYGGIPALKSVMRFIGLDLGPVRLPLRPLPEEAWQQMKTELEQNDLLPL